MKYLISLVCSVAGIFIIIFLVKYFSKHEVEMAGDGMNPTIMPKELLFVHNDAYSCVSDVERFDIVCFKLIQNPSEYIVRRVIGLPKDHITINETKGLTINQTNIVYMSGCITNLFRDIIPVTQPYIYQKTQSLKLREEEFFVVGDNSDNHWDSRCFGAVAFSNIIGKVL